MCRTHQHQKIEAPRNYLAGEKCGHTKILSSFWRMSCSRSGLQFVGCGAASTLQCFHAITASLILHIRIHHKIKDGEAFSNPGEVNYHGSLDPRKIKEQTLSTNMMTLVKCQMRTMTNSTKVTQRKKSRSLYSALFPWKAGLILTCFNLRWYCALCAMTWCSIRITYLRCQSALAA